MSYIKYQNKMVIVQDKYVISSPPSYPQPVLVLNNGVTVNVNISFTMDSLIFSVSDGTPPYEYQWKMDDIGLGWTVLNSDPTAVSKTFNCIEYNSVAPGYLVLVDVRVKDANNQYSEIQSTFVQLQDPLGDCDV
jgi:hypothetical protein